MQNMNSGASQKLESVLKKTVRPGRSPRARMARMVLGQVSEQVFDSKERRIQWQKDFRHSKGETRGGGGGRKAQVMGWGGE